MSQHLKLVSLLIFLCADFLPAVAVNRSKLPHCFRSGTRNIKRLYRRHRKDVIPPRFESGSDFRRVSRQSALAVNGDLLIMLATSPSPLLTTPHFRFPMESPPFMSLANPFEGADTSIIPATLSSNCNRNFHARASKEGFAVVDLYNDAIGEDLADTSTRAAIFQSGLPMCLPEIFKRSRPCSRFRNGYL